MHQRIDQLHSQICDNDPAFNFDANLVGPSSLDEALEVLWSDPDPDTAGWVLMVDHLLKSKGHCLCDRQTRTGLSTSAFLESQLKGQIHRDHHEFPHLSKSPLFHDLLPTDLLWVADHGWLHSWMPGEQITHKELILLVLSGEGTEVLIDGEEVRYETGSLIGAMDVISGESSRSSIHASAKGMEAFAFPSHAFDELLSRSSKFSHGLLRQFCARLKKPNSTLSSQSSLYT